MKLFKLFILILLTFVLLFYFLPNLFLKHRQENIKEYALKNCSSIQTFEQWGVCYEKNAFNFISTDYISPLIQFSEQGNTKAQFIFYSLSKDSTNHIPKERAKEYLFQCAMADNYSCMITALRDFHAQTNEKKLNNIFIKYYSYVKQKTKIYKDNFVDDKEMSYLLYLKNNPVSPREKVQCVVYNQCD